MVLCSGKCTKWLSPSPEDPTNKAVSTRKSRVICACVVEWISRQRTTDFCRLIFQFITIKLVCLELDVLYIIVFKDLFTELADFLYHPKGMPIGIKIS